MPNGKQSKIAHIGSVQLTPTLLLSNVLHVPDFQFNLLSVSKLCNQLASRIIFTPSDCILQGPTSQEVVLGRACSGLYHVQHTPTLKVAAVVGTKLMQKDCCQTLKDRQSCFSVSWHSGLGHLSFDKIKQLGLPCNNNSTSICSICPKARLHKQSFPLSNTRASRFFELIHVDIWGAYKCVTHDGYKYFLTIVDDFSRATWVHLMSTKSNVFPLLQQFVAYVKTQFKVTSRLLEQIMAWNFKTIQLFSFMQKNELYTKKLVLKHLSRMVLQRGNTNIY